MSQLFPLVRLLDDDEAVRQSLSLLLSTVGLRVRAHASSDCFFREFDPAAPGVILLDIRMPDASGVSVLEQLREREAMQPVIVLTGHATVDLCRRAFKAGAMEFLEKPVSDDVLIDTVQRCLKVHLMELGRLTEEREARERFRCLSAREKDVLELLIAGLTNREMGRALNVSPRTVEVHRANLLQKLGTDSLVQLVRRYAPLVEAGLAA